MTDIVSRLKSRIHDLPMADERMLDDAQEEIERLRAALQEIADSPVGHSSEGRTQRMARDALSVSNGDRING